jgi:hypothetical protein
VQLLVTDEKQTLSEEQRMKIQEYLDSYYKRLHVQVFWGTCREFMRELSQRWEAFNGGS